MHPTILLKFAGCPKDTNHTTACQHRLISTPLIIIFASVILRLPFIWSQYLFNVSYSRSFVTTWSAVIHIHASCILTIPTDRVTILSRALGKGSPSVRSDQLIEPIENSEVPHKGCFSKSFRGKMPAAHLWQGPCCWFPNKAACVLNGSFVFHAPEQLGWPVSNHCVIGAEC